MEKANIKNEIELDLGDDLVIIKVIMRSAGNGNWVSGTKHGHRFDAPDFQDHVECDWYEIDRSKISKLWIQQFAEKQSVFNWDRGLDQPATTPVAQSIVEFLCVGLAEHVYA